MGGKANGCYGYWRERILGSNAAPMPRPIICRARSSNTYNSVPPWSLTSCDENVNILRSSRSTSHTLLPKFASVYPVLTCTKDQKYPYVEDVAVRENIRSNMCVCGGGGIQHWNSVLLTFSLPCPQHPCFNFIFYALLQTAVYDNRKQNCQSWLIWCIWNQNKSKLAPLHSYWLPTLARQAHWTTATDSFHFNF
jgi:hypothetical protein